MVVSAQIIPLGNPVAPFIQQLLQYPLVPLEGVAVGTYT